MRHLYEQDCCAEADPEAPNIAGAFMSSSLWFVLSSLESAGCTETIHLQYMNIVIQSVYVKHW